MKFFDVISDRFRSFFSSGSKSRTDDPDTYAENREKIVAFSIALIISLCLWFIVNLSRDFNVSIEIPIQIANVPNDEIVSSDVPESAMVNLSGEGWNIISVYNNPPRVLLTVQDGSVNLADQMRNQISAFSDLNIIQVQPTQLTVETERKATKVIPVINNVRLNMQEQFGLMAQPLITPDSVTISGAESKLQDITQWQTAEVVINNVNSDIQRTVELQEPEFGLSLSPNVVSFEAQITEFTEAEVRVPIRTRNLPSGMAVTYNPSSVMVRFDVPLDQYSVIQGARPFRAYVDYSVIEEDSSGRVSPEIEVVETDYFIRLRSFQPPRVAYFRIVPE
ncbi:CdaR family protein [Rhodohalobacter sp. 614A]|uniref:CdaR family protein n=1 Tax=Rhodohalobacter sp. 614A TaxID=2908649 RepID=UPI001F3989D2|nr:CdaR family protein [Rhodohalobacter sp. 614A]